MRAESSANDLHQMQYAFALPYQIYEIYRSLHADCPLGEHGSRMVRQ
jgi:hypothetical protein